MKRLILAVFIAAGLAVPAQSQAALSLGVIDNVYANQRPDLFFGDLTALGATWVRYDVGWDRIAKTAPASPRENTDPAYDWAQTDALVNRANAEGKKVLLTVYRTPAWARKAKTGTPNWADAPDLVKWRAFIHAISTRYVGKMTAIELGNEPNSAQFLKPQFIGKKRVGDVTYVNLLNAGYAEAKAVSKKILVVGGALNHVTSKKSMSPIAFVKTMGRLKAKFDALSIHPYNAVMKCGIYDGAINPATGKRCGSAFPNVMLGNWAKFEAEVKKAFPGKRFPIWVTEYGWETVTPDYPNNVNAVTAAQQAVFLKQAVTRFRSKFPRVTVLIQFLIVDEDSNVPGRVQQGTWQSGLRYSANDKKKPAFNALAQLFKK